MNKAGKIVTILLWVLVLVSAVLIVSLMANVSDNNQDAAMQSWINTNLIWAYILLIAGAAIAIFSGLYHMITDIKAAKGGLIALVFLGAVALISYLISSDAIPQFAGVQRFIDDGTLTAQVSKLVDTGLHATYILLGLAILSIAYSSISRLFR